MSLHNLLPNRLRDRRKSGAVVSDIQDTANGVQTKLFTSRGRLQETQECEEIKEYTEQIENDNTSVNCNLQAETRGSRMEVKIKSPLPVDVDDFEKGNQEKKMGTIISTLNNLCLKIAELDTQNNHETDGLQTQITTVHGQADNNSDAIAKVKKENDLLKGLVQRQYQQILDLNDKVAHLTARSMENNVTVAGLMGDIGFKEKCKTNVIEFLKKQVEIDVNEDEILFTHRVGKFYKEAKRPRIMLVKCTHLLKERILSNASILKDKENANGDGYYINKQLPEKLMEERRERRATIQEVTRREVNLPVKERMKVEVKQNVVYLDGEPVKKNLLSPQPLDLFPDDNEKEKIDSIKLAASDVTTESNSDFQAYAVKTNSQAEVNRAYRKVRSLHPSATHVIAVFNFKTKNGFQDDGEHGAGFKLLKAIQAETGNNVNIAVFVTRVYGGVHMGQYRHKVIKEVALQAIRRIGK